MAFQQGGVVRSGTWRPPSFAVASGSISGRSANQGSDGSSFRWTYIYSGMATSLPLRTVLLGGVELFPAIVNKHLEAVEWLKINAPPCAESVDNVVYAAGSAGNIEVLTWLHLECCIPLEGALGGAQLEGQWGTARWLLENCELDDIIINWSAAARHGELEFLKFAFSMTIEGLNKDAMHAAAAGGHLDIIEWLHHDAGLELRSEAARRAAEHGHLDIVKWFRENHCVGWDSGINDAAAISDNIEIMKWLQENSSDPCRASTLNCAAAHGCLQVVKWLHDEYGLKNGSVLAMDAAARSGHLNIIQYLHTNRSEGCTTAAMDCAARSGHLDVVKWLHFHRQEGCSVHAMDWAARKGHLEIIKWLHENRSEGCTNRAMNSAAANGHLAIVKWLYHNRSESCTREAMAIAIVEGQFEVIKFLHAHLLEGFSFEEESVCIYNPFLELMQWLIANYPQEMNGCKFTVPVWDRHFSTWCRETNLQCDDSSEWVCNTALLRRSNTVL